MRWAIWIALVGGCSGGAAKPAPAKDAAPAHHARPDAGTEAHKDEPEEHEELPRTVELTPKVVKEAGIKVAPVQTEALPQTLNLTGEIVADPDRSATVTPRVQGRIVDVRFKEGERVKAGALLAVVESPDLAKARATHASAAAKARNARQNADRLANVARKGLASGQEVSQAEAEATAVEAEARAAKQTLQAFGQAALESTGSARVELRAPIEGTVLARNAVRGQTVEAEHAVAMLANLDRAYFTARLFEKDLARVKLGASTEVRLNAYPGDVLEGVVEIIGKQLDPTARTVVARISVKNRNDLLKVGLFGTANVVVADTTPRTPRPVVPLAAVTRIGERDAVFVRHPDGHFEVHPVTLGRSAGGKVEVLSGLRTGEQVVVDGVFTLKSIVLKSSFGEED